MKHAKISRAYTQIMSACGRSLPLYSASCFTARALSFLFLFLFLFVYFFPPQPQKPKGKRHRILIFFFFFFDLFHRDFRSLQKKKGTIITDWISEYWAYMQMFMPLFSHHLQVESFLVQVLYNLTNFWFFMPLFLAG